MKRLFHKTVLSLALLLVLPLSASANARGDANGDSQITINDVAALIDRLLSNDAYMPHYDTNCDGVFSISDVTELIDYLLTGTWSSGYVVPDNAEFYTVNGVTFAMVPVEGGTFMMGDGRSEGSHYPHLVQLSSFKIGLTEVTQELWEAVMGENPSPTTGANLPVDQVTWYQCMDFTARLRELTGVNFQLPTDAQWEFAARGGNLSQGYYYSGSDSIDDVAWYNIDGHTGSVHPVAQKNPNELGIYDMSGNAWEWCYDRYSIIYEHTVQPLYIDPVFDQDIYNANSHHLKRGASIIDYAGIQSSVYLRRAQYPSIAWNADGLRLAIWP